MFLDLGMPLSAVVLILPVRTDKIGYSAEVGLLFQGLCTGSSSEL